MEENKKKNKVNKRSLNNLMMGLLIFLLLIGGIYYVMNQYHTKTIKEKAMIYAQIIAAKTDGDLLLTLEPGDEGTEVYNKMASYMYELFEDSEVSYAYSLKQNDMGKAEYVVAADPDGDPYDIGTPYDISVPDDFSDFAMKEAFAGKVTVMNEPYEDEWGVFYTAYAPIYNESEEVVGVIGIDYANAKVKAQVRKLVWQILLVMTSGIAAFWIIRQAGFGNKDSEDVLNTNRSTRKLTYHELVALKHKKYEINQLLEGIHTNVAAIKGASSDIKNCINQLPIERETSTEQAQQMENKMQEMYDNIEESIKNIKDIMNDSLNKTE